MTYKTSLMVLAIVAVLAVAPAAPEIPNPATEVIRQRAKEAVKQQVGNEADDRLQKSADKKADNKTTSSADKILHESNDAKGAKSGAISSTNEDAGWVVRFQPIGRTQWLVEAWTTKRSAGDDEFTTASDRARVVIEGGKRADLDVTNKARRENSRSASASTSTAPAAHGTVIPPETREAGPLRIELQNGWTLRLNIKATENSVALAQVTGAGDTTEEIGTIENGNTEEFSAGQNVHLKINVPADRKHDPVQAEVWGAKAASGTHPAAP